MLSNAAREYANGALDLSNDKLLQSAVDKVLSFDKFTSTRPSPGTNVGSTYSGADMQTDVIVGLSYNPYSRYMTAGIRANCKFRLPAGQPATNFYTVRVQLNPDGTIVKGTAWACSPYVHMCKPLK